MPEGAHKVHRLLLAIAGSWYRCDMVSIAVPPDHDHEARRHDEDARARRGLERRVPAERIS